MLIKFKNTEVQIHHLKIGTVVSMEASNGAPKYAHVVGFASVWKDSTVLWVQFEQMHDAKVTFAKDTFAKDQVEAKYLTLVGH